MKSKLKIIFAILAVGLIFFGINLAERSENLAPFFRFPEEQSADARSARSAGKPVEPVSVCGFDVSGRSDRTRLIFKEIAWMGDQESATNEWFSLRKIRAGTLDISGYQIFNRTGKLKIVLPDKTVLTDEEPELILGRQYQLAGLRPEIVFSGGIKNSEEGLRLFDADCRLLDEVLADPAWPAGDNDSKETMKRNLNDLGWYISSSSEKSSEPPGQEMFLSGNKTTGILISEVVVGTEKGSDDEFVVLYNSTGEGISLTGWSVKKKSAKGSESTLVSPGRLENKEIPADDYFLLANEKGYRGEPIPDAVWPASYTLAYKNNGVALYNPEGEVVDETNWTEIPAGESWKRISWTEEKFELAELTFRKVAD
jgi:hypothetical protein